ncbi:insulin-degrading enzyme [Pholiota conissans]|uniref:Insulin-degrading enzyme n=1 Tax=Pholiota conissans TaxID=109636 RepID=A0A9P5Z8Z2_9AGAR|nr:insulin-degrading enzyme [Pholiota conissans]
MFKCILRPRLKLSSIFPSLYYPPSVLLPSIFSTPHIESMTTLANSDWTLVEKPGAIPYQVFTKPIVKSEQDDRDYRIIKLQNGLQATLVHDVNADKAAASLDVAIGHLYDPDDVPGLAHFCEHLLFMGTEKFPQENDYSEFLSKNNGSSNAYTSTSNTNYYFNVATSALPGALERFSAFFHCPLFAPSCTLRELNAVDSEHKKNHQADMWRIFQLNKHLTKPGHPWAKFGSGNRDSLSKAAKERPEKSILSHVSVPASFTHLQTPISSRIPSPAPSQVSISSETDEDGGSVGRETRRRLVEWWNKEYCASRMRLAIVGKESLDDLANLTAKFFSPIQNRGREGLPMINDHPFGSEQKGTLVSVQTIMAFHALEISFPLEYQPPFWKYKPANFISHFVGHEGPGSLHSYLKNKHWLTALSCGPQNLARGFAMFKITVYLTPEGFENYRSVILAAYKYIELLRSSSFDDYHHQEVANLSSIRFRFAEKRRPDNYATWISEHTAWPIPPELLLTAPRLAWNWENEEERQRGEKKTKEYLEKFRISESRVVLMAKKDDHVKLHPDLSWEKEPYYGTDYAVQRFDDIFIAEAEGKNDIPDFFLPGPNEFIPTNLEVEKKEVVEPLKRPLLIRQTQLSTLWHKKDDMFWVPKAHVVVDMRSHVANSSARASVLTRLYSDVVNDSLTEFSYNADLAGLSYKFTPHAAGLYVSMNGYNDKMAVLVDHVLEKIKSVPIDPKRLDVVKEEARREYENFFLGQSYSLSDYYARYLMTKQQYTQEEKLKELPTITVAEVQEHRKSLLSQVSVRILAAGNLYKDEAIKIAEIVEDGLGQSPFSAAKLNDHGLILPEGSNFIYSAPIPNPNQANSALTYFTYFGPITDQKLRTSSALLTQILSEPAFNILRTREQLGYIVTCTSWTLPGDVERGLRIVIQSEKKPGYLETRVEAFLDDMKTKLEEMTKEEFAIHRTSLQKKWREANKNLAEEVSKYLGQVTNGHHDFYRREKDATLLDVITKDDILKLFLSRVHQSSNSRAKLSVHMISQKPRPKHVSATASEAFEGLVHQKLPEVDVKAWKTVIPNENPTIIDYGQYWAKNLKEHAKELLVQLPAIVDSYPVEGDEDRKMPDAVFIEDMKSFRNGLEVSVDPGPMVEWNDLPISRF